MLHEKSSNSGSCSFLNLPPQSFFFIFSTPCTTPCTEDPISGQIPSPAIGRTHHLPRRSPIPSYRVNPETSSRRRYNGLYAVSPLPYHLRTSASRQRIYRALP